MTVNRAAPDVPNAVSGNVGPEPEPVSPDLVKLSIRVEPRHVKKLAELQARAITYVARNEPYERAEKLSRSIALDPQTHAWLKNEARALNVTMNALIVRLLDDKTLDPGDPDRNHFSPEPFVPTTVTPEDFTEPDNGIISNKRSWTTIAGNLTIDPKAARMLLGIGPTEEDDDWSDDEPAMPAVQIGPPPSGIATTPARNPNGHLMGSRWREWAIEDPAGAVYQIEWDAGTHGRILSKRDPASPHVGEIRDLDGRHFWVWGHDGWHRFPDLLSYVDVVIRRGGEMEGKFVRDTKFTWTVHRNGEVTPGYATAR